MGDIVTDLSKNTLAFTGHRPDKLGGYGEDVALKLIRCATQIITELRPQEVISGMALGWDQAVAYAAIRMKIPVTAAIPFVGQEAVWPEASRARYLAILKKCSQIKVISKGGYSAQKMHIRNEWMVDHCVQLIALWDGTAGGTKHCIEYAKAAQVPWLNVWKSWENPLNV